MSKYHANELLNNRKNDIQHWKYVKKIPVGKGYRYFYSWDEYKAYLADPTAELKKVGNAAKSEIKKAGKKSYTEVKSQGKKVVEKASLKKNGSNITISSVKAKNNSRDTGFRDRINNLAKKASEKWNKNKNAAKKSIEKGKQKIDKILHPIQTIKEKIEKRKAEKERKRLEEIRKNKATKDKLAKKYKYLLKKTINGRTVYFYSQEEIDAWEKKQNYIANEPKFMNDVKKSEVPYTSEEDAILVNPRFNDPWDDDYQVNCAECTAIYELRRRGYDVESNGMSGNDWEGQIKYNTDKRYDLFYKNAQIDRLPVTKSDSETVKELEKEFSKMPPGSRGDISFKWAGYNAAHSIAWEVDSKGEVHFVDAQPSGQGNKVEYDFKTLAKAMDTTTTYRRKDFGSSDGKGLFKGREKVSSVRIVRTDNLQLKPEIKDICQDSGTIKRKPETKQGKKYINQYSKDTNATMTEKEIVTKYPNLYEPKQIKAYNRDYDKWVEDELKKGHSVVTYERRY